MSPVVDLTPIVQPLVTLAAGVIAGVLTALAARVVAVLEQKLHVELTTQQQSNVYNAASTAAGVLTTLLKRGAISSSEVHVTNPQVRDLADLAIKRVPAAVLALGVTPESMAHMIVSRVAYSLDDTLATPVPSALVAHP